MVAKRFIVESSVRTSNFCFLSICFIVLSACAAQNSGISKDTVPNARSFTQAGPDEEASCLEVCGNEARGTVYASCLETGEIQQECGHNARLWYRDCLQARCGESAIQLDDCRTDCRIDSKEQIAQCSINDTECKRQIRAVMHTCIDECEQQ